MRIRGVVEGFYGEPWSHAERLDLIGFCGGQGLDTWVHAPKDDPYHRGLWREPYPDEELERLGELVGAAELHGVDSEVVSIGITREALNLAVARFRGHELLIWDNYPVNDFDRGRLFLGPLVGLEPVPSKLALATVADWTRDPEAYDPIASYERALREHGAEVLDALRRLAPQPAPVNGRPADVPALVEALELGVDAAAAQPLLEPFV